jgi:hypothetical protein
MTDQSTEFEAKRPPVNTNDLRDHVAYLARNASGVPMSEWNAISNAFLQAAYELDDTRTQRNIERARADKAEAELDAQLTAHLKTMTSYLGVRKAAAEAMLCFEAADAEGLPQRLWDDGHQHEVGDLQDLVIRRLLPAYDFLANGMKE